MKKISPLALLFFAFMFHQATAQVPLIGWQKCLGGNSLENANAIQQTADSGFVVAGYTLSTNGDVSGNHGNYDTWVVKLNKAHSLVWQKCLGGTDIDEGYSVHQTSDGGYFISGLSASTDGDVTGNHGDYDYWAVKLDAAGGLTWQKSLGGSAADVSYCGQQTHDGGYIMAGYAHSSDGDVTGIHGSDDCWVVKLDNSGTLLWQKCLGGTNSEFATDIKETADHGFIMAASSSSSDGDITLNHGQDDYWIVKLDSAGNLIWQKSFGGSGHDTPKSIEQTDDGGYIVAGTTSSTNGDVTVHLGSSDYWVIKLSSAGDLLWQKSLGGSAADYANAIRITENGYAVAGRSYSDDVDVTGHYGVSDYWVAQLDLTGNIQWEKSLGGTLYDEALALVETIDSGLVITGNSSSTGNDVSGNHGNGDVWVVRLLKPSCQVYYFDGDGDTYGGSVTDTFCNSIPSGWVTNNLDCDDANASINPAGAEICNSLDDNCNGYVDEGVGDTFYADNDVDGYGDPLNTIISCTQPYGYVLDNGDCDDNNYEIHPGAYELCNSIDDNCVNGIDEGLPVNVYYQDADGDGYGNPLVTDSACNGAPIGFVSDSTDCDDTKASVHPGVPEIPNNGIDDNCNGEIDEIGVGISDPKALAEFTIHPNPAQDYTTIQFTLPQQSHVSIKIFTVSGREIATLLDDYAAKGNHALDVPTSEFSKGVYVVKIIGDFGITNRKLVVQ